MSFDPLANAEYLRKRFSERIWDSQLVSFHKHVDPEDLEPIIDALVTGLLTEMGAE